MSSNPHRILLVDFKTTDVTGEIPFIFHRAGCTIDVFAPKGSWLLKSRYLDTWHPADNADPLSYVTELGRIVQTHTYDWVVPLDDASLYVIQDYANTALAQQVLPITDLNFRTLVGSKSALSQLSLAHSIRTPAFAVHNGSASILDDVRGIHYPLLLKVDRSGGGKGLYLCTNKEEVESNYAKIPTHQRHNLLIQQYVPGDNISVEALYRNGKLITYASARVTQNVRNEFDISCVRDYGPIAGLAPLLEQIGSTFTFNGFCSFTFMRERDGGALYLIEADLRSHAWFALSRIAGVDFSAAIRRRLDNDTRTVHPPTTHVEIRHFARDIIRACRAYDVRTILNWFQNKNQRWKSIPTHDFRLLLATLRQVSRTLFYDHAPKIPYARNVARFWRYLVGSARTPQTPTIFQTYVRYFSHNTSMIAASVLLSLAQVSVLAPIPIITKDALDVALPQKDAYHLVWSLSVTALLLLCSTIFMLAHRRITLTTSKSIIATIRRRLIERVLTFHFSYYATEDLEQVHSRIVEDTERLDRVTNAFLGQTLPALLVAMSLGGVLYYLNPILFGTIILCLPLMYFAGRVLGRRVRERVKHFHTDFNSFSAGASFVLKFNELITLSAAERHERDRQYDRIAALEQSGKGVAWATAVYSAVQNNVVVLSGLVVSLIGGLQMLHGSSTIGAVLSFFGALNIMISNLRTILSSIPTLIEGAESCRTLMPLLESATPTTPLSTKTRHFAFPIAFNAVSFTYGASFALRDVSFSITQGSVIGIFGASGSGKTTLIRLLLGVYTPTHGTITVSGMPLDAIDAPHYRRQIGTLPQEPLLFPGTIRENLVYGLDAMPDELLIAMCKRCQIHDAIAALPQGYDTRIGHRGATLSGGQRQRIAIARALLRQPKLLIFDEPDNHLDDALILDIMSATRELGCTIILISHNPALRTLVDTALTVADGRVTVTPLASEQT